MGCTAQKSGQHGDAAVHADMQLRKLVQVQQLKISMPSNLACFVRYVRWFESSSQASEVTGHQLTNAGSCLANTTLRQVTFCTGFMYSHYYMYYHCY